MVSSKEQTDLMKSTFTEEKKVLSERITSLAKELEVKNSEMEITMSNLQRSKLEMISLEQTIKSLKSQLDKSNNQQVHSGVEL